MCTISYSFACPSQPQRYIPPIPIPISVIRSRGYRTPLRRATNFEKDFMKEVFKCVIFLSASLQLSMSSLSDLYFGSTGRDGGQPRGGKAAGGLQCVSKDCSCHRPRVGRRADENMWLLHTLRGRETLRLHRRYYLGIRLGLYLSPFNSLDMR